MIELYTKSITDEEKEIIKQWIPLANKIYNIGLIKSCEIVLFQDILDDNLNILISGEENKVNMLQDIKEFLSNGESSLVLIHNHSGMETCFSNRDIEVLFDYPRIKYIVVINSKHEIYILGTTKVTKSRDSVMELFWSWWSDSERIAISLKYKTALMLAHSPLAIHANNKEYEELIRIEDGVMVALHRMTSSSEFINFAENAGFNGAYLCYEVVSGKI